jgi:hypothetical protein
VDLDNNTVGRLSAFNIQMNYSEEPLFNNDEITELIEASVIYLASKGMEVDYSEYDDRPPLGFQSGPGRTEYPGVTMIGHSNTEFGRALTLVFRITPETGTGANVTITSDLRIIGWSK